MINLYMVSAASSFKILTWQQILGKEELSTLISVLSDYLTSVCSKDHEGVLLTDEEQQSKFKRSRQQWTYKSKEDRQYSMRRHAD
eukprot:627487-Ditylum_brightwellii.AAC.1